MKYKYVTEMALKHTKVSYVFILFSTTALLYVINDQWISRINLVRRVTNTSTVRHGKHNTVMVNRSYSMEQTISDNHYDQWNSRINLVPRVTNTSTVQYGKHNTIMVDRSYSTEQTISDNHYDQWNSRINLVPRVTNTSTVLYGKHNTIMVDRSYSTEQTILDNHYLMCPQNNGRLGNLMFQFSAAFAIAHTLRYKVCIQSTHPLIRYFEIEHICKLRLTNMTIITEAQFRNDTWKTDNKYILHNLTLSGYFQSWKYFINSTNEIRKAFTFKPTYLNKAREFLASKVKPNDTVVGLHIRRGDFMSAQRNGYTVADLNYIRKAIEFYREKYATIKFVIVSDDMSWCKHNIKGTDIIYSTLTQAAGDMALLSLCNHTIITGGTFSWWGGWLAGGTVVYLKDFPRPGSWLEKITPKREDYYLPQWIGMNNG